MTHSRLRSSVPGRRENADVSCLHAGRTVFRPELYKKLLRLAEGAENPFPAGLDISGLRDRAQRVREEIRSLNDRILKAGWTSELIE